MTRPTGLLMLLCAALPSGTWGGEGTAMAPKASPLGSEFQVNTYTTSDQSYSDVAVEPDGDFVIVWHSDGSFGTDTSGRSIQGQRYVNGVPDGSQFEVNTYTTSNQFRPDVAADRDGDLVVVWTSYGSGFTDTSFSSIQGQRYDSSGTSQGSQFQVNTYTTGFQGSPAVAKESDGDFVVVWHSFGSDDSDTSLRSIQGQRYASDGTPQGSQFQVNTYTTDFQEDPAVAVGSNGDFVVVWESNGSADSDTSSQSIQAQRFAYDGMPLEGQLEVNAYTTNTQLFPSVAMEPDGGFVVTWHSYGSAGSDTSFSSIQGQSFTSDGQPRGSQFQVNTYTTGFQRLPSVGVDSAGSFAVVWDSAGSAGSDTSFSSIQAQRFANQADLSITNTDGVTSAVPGESLTYTIVAANNGPSNVSAATFTDNFPTALTCSYTSFAVGGASGNTSGSGNILHILTLPAGSSVTYRVDCMIDSAADGALSNTATIFSGTADPAPGNNTVIDLDTLTPEVDLAVLKLDDPDPVITGAVLTYTIEVANTGSSNATDVTVVDTLPRRVTLTSAEGDGWSCDEAGRVITCMSPTLAASETAPPITVEVTAPDEPGLILNQVTVSSDEADTGPENDSADAETTVEPSADLTVAVSDDPDPVPVGRNLRYDVTVTNNGPFAAEDTMLAIDLPAGAELVLAQGCIEDFVAVRVCSLGDIPNGTAKIVNLTVTAPLDPGPISLRAAASSTTFEANPGDETLEEETVVVPATDLTVEQSDSVDPVTGADDVTYTVTVSNRGPFDAEDLAVDSMLSRGVPDGTSSGCAEDPTGSPTCSLGTLPAGDTATYMLTVTAPADAAGALVHTATVRSSTFELNPGNETSTEVTTLEPPPDGGSVDLAISITELPTAVPGEAVNYTVTVRNLGSLNAIGAKVSSIFRPATADASWTCPDDDDVSCIAGTVFGDLVDVLDLMAGASKTYPITATVTPGVTGILSYTAMVVTGLAGVADIDPSNDKATARTELQPANDPILSLDNGLDKVIADKPVDYVLTVSNAGPSSVEALLTTQLPVIGLHWNCTTFTAIFTALELDGLPCRTDAGAGTDAGVGDISESLMLFPGKEQIYELQGWVPADAVDELVSTAFLQFPLAEGFLRLKDLEVMDIDPVVPSQVQTLGEARQVAEGGNPDIDFNDSGEALVVFEQASDGIVRVVARRVETTGEVLAGKIEISEGMGTNPRVGFDPLTDPEDPESLADTFPAAAKGTVVNNGSFIAVWDEQQLDFPSRIWAQLVRRGRRLGPRQELSHRSTSQIRPDVDAGSAGGFLVVWESTRVEGGGAEASGIFGRRLDRFGRPVEPSEKRIDVSRRLDPQRPAVAGDGEGYFVVWDVPRSVDTNARHIVGQRLGADGEPLGDELAISAGGGRLSQADVTLAAEGFLAVWSRAGATGGIAGRLLDGMGEPLGQQFQIGKPDDRRPRVAAVEQASIVVWERPLGPLGERSVTFAQVIDREGNPVGKEYRVRSPADGRAARKNGAETGARPAVAFAPRGTVPDADKADIFFVVWDDIAELGPGQGEVWSQRYAVSADLLLTVFDDPDPLLATGGASLTYRVSVTNLLTVEAVDVFVTHDFPDGVTPVLTTGCAEDPSAFGVCTLGTIAGGEVREYVIEASVAAGLVGTLSLSALAESSTPELDESDNAEVEITRLGEADLSVVLAAEGELDAGKEAVWRITVRNDDGSSTANLPVVLLELPGGVHLVSTAGCGEDPAGVPVCSLDDLGSGEETEIELVVQLGGGLTEVTQEVVVIAATADPDLSNNVTSRTVPLPGSRLAMELEAPASVAPGSVFTLRAIATNDGDEDAEDAVVNLPLPEDVVAESSSGCAEDPDGTPLCGLGRLEPGAERTVSFDLRPSTSATGELSLAARLATPSEIGIVTATARTQVGDPAVLRLLGGRFTVRVDWKDGPDATSDSGFQVPYSDNTGFFWFFDQSNIELVVKILDGGPINGNFWFFHGGLSDVEYDITVTDLETGAERTYHNPPGEICGQGDTSAFPGADGLLALEPGAVDRSPSLKTGGCTEGPESLCLNDGRFRVDVELSDGMGQAITGTDNTGYFWFFNEENLELAVKVLDGRQINGKFWVFYGALSDVEYTITVTDTETGVVREYRNPQGEICGGADTQAF